MNPVANTLGCITIETDVRRLSADAWAGLSHRHPSLRLENLLVHAETDYAQGSILVFLQVDDAGLAAAAVCRKLLPSHPASSLHVLFGRATDQLCRFGVFRRPVLECCSLSTVTSGFALRPDDLLADARKSALLDAMQAAARTNGWDFACLASPAGDTAIHAELERRGYLRAPLADVATLEITWQDFEGYVASQRKRGKNARSEFRRNREAGVEIRRVAAVGESIDALHALFTAHHHHKNGWEPSVSLAYLHLLADRIGDDFVLFEAVKGGQRIAMLGLIRDGANGWASLFGIDLNDRQKDYTYPSIAFYNLVSTVPALGIRRILYGSGALEAKRQRGCDIEASALYYRPSGGLLSWFGRPMFRMQRAWKARKRTPAAKPTAAPATSP